MCCMSKDITEHDKKNAQPKKLTYLHPYNHHKLLHEHRFLQKQKLTVELANTEQCNWTKQLGSLVTLKKEGTRTHHSRWLSCSNIFQAFQAHEKCERPYMVSIRFCFWIFFKTKHWRHWCENTHHVAMSGFSRRFSVPTHQSSLAMRRCIRFCTWIREFCTWISMFLIPWISMFLIPFPMLGRCVYDRSYCVVSSVYAMDIIDIHIYAYCSVWIYTFYISCIL